MELGNEKKSGGERLYPLSKPLICFSKEGDHFTTGNACEHVLISGRPGGAKTTSSLALFGQSYMEAGFGALVLCAKSSASDEAWEMAQRAGRARDVIFFGPNSKQCFNWADYEYHEYGDGIGRVDNLMNVFSSAMEVMSRAAGDRGAEPFWEYANAQGMKNLFFIDGQAHGSISLARILEMWQSLPQSFSDLENPEKLAVLRYLAMAEENCPVDQQRGLILARNYVLSEMPRLSERTRACIQQMAIGMLDPHVRDLMHDAMGGKSTWTPDDILNGKIVIVSYDVKRFDLVGKLINVICKRSLIAAVERRLGKFRNQMAKCRPVVLIADEAANFIDSKDVGWLRTARESRGCALFAYQSIPTMIDELGGGEKAKTQVDALLGMFQTKICHQNDCDVTNVKYAEIVSKDLMTRRGGTYGAGPGGPSAGLSWSDQNDYILPPIAFKTVPAGGVENNWEVRAFVLMAGRIWKATGKNYLKVKFFQVCEPYKHDKHFANYPRDPIYIFLDRAPTARGWVFHVPFWEFLRACVRNPKMAYWFYLRWLAFWLNEGAYLRGGSSVL